MEVVVSGEQGLAVGAASWAATGMTTSEDAQEPRAQDPPPPLREPGPEDRRCGRSAPEGLTDQPPWRQKHRQLQNLRHASDSRDTQGKAVGAQERTRGQRRLLGEGDVVISFKGYNPISQVKKEGRAQGLWDSPDRRPASAKEPRSEEWESAWGRGPQLCCWGQREDALQGAAGQAKASGQDGADERSQHAKCRVPITDLHPHSSRWR